MNPDYLMALEKVTSYKKIDGGVILQVDLELCEILFLKENLVRIRISQGGKFIESPSNACVKYEFEKEKVSIVNRKGILRITGKQLEVNVDKENFSVAILRRDGSTLLAPTKEAPFYQFQNNHFIINRHCKPNDHIYGLGEKTGHLDRHGRTLTLWNKDVLAPDPDKHISDLISESEKSPLDTDFDPYYMSIPFYYKMNCHTLAASGHFIDNPYKGTFTFDNNKNHSHISTMFNGGQYCEYFFAGPQIKEILADYSELTGRIERPPLWTLGYHQCRWKKYSHEDLIKLAEKQRESKVPCDVLWLDIDYMDEYRVFTWNDELFPTREKLFEKLREMGFRVITIVDPGIKFEPSYKVFDEAREQNLLCKCENGQIYIGQVWPGKTAFPDFTKSACRKWWGDKNADLIKQGIAGIWNDMNEPATGKIGHSDMRFAGEDNGNYPHERFHNEYALLMAQATVEGLRRAEPDLRTFVLSRGGSAGIQRFAANWMGDNASRWDHLQMSLPMAMGLGLSGQPFVGADIGGFVHPTHPELFIRWMQCGAFTPFCRNHNDDAVDQYVWTFGEGVRKICEKFIKLRYRLLPYIYSQFVKSSQTGCPIQRPLVYDYQEDPACRQIDDQYLFGEDILVAPVITQGATSRQVYLPKGEWFFAEKEKFYEGEQWISVEAPIDFLPWFIRCGSVIPMLKNAPESTMNIDTSRLQLLCPLPSKSGKITSQLIEDDGLSFEFEKGNERISEFTVENSKSKISIKSTIIHDSYSENSRSNIELFTYSNKKLQWNKEKTKTVGNATVINFKNKKGFEVSAKKST